MADEDKKNSPEDNSGTNLIDTTSRVRLNPVPLKFGGEKKASGSQRLEAPRRKGLPTAEEARREYEEVESPRKIVRQGMLIIFLFFGVLGVWSFFGTISGAVVGVGRIKFEDERKIVQHLEGGIVDAVLVHDGQEVVEGEPLLILESVQTNASASAMRKELVLIEAQRLRAQAERDEKKELSWPDELRELAANAQSLDALANEERIFQSRAQMLDTQVSLLKSQLDQLEAQVAGHRDQLTAENKIIAAIQDELGSKRKLHRDRYVDKTQILSLERDLAAHQGTRGRLRQQIAEAKQRAAELNLRITETRGKYIEEATKNLGDLEAKIVQQREKLRPLDDAARRLQIKAPVTGRVVDLQVHTRGAVVRPGETIMDIVPHDHPLIVETQVPINKITELYVGQPAKVQLDAFDTRMVPAIPGHVSYISADAVRPDGMDPYYVCHVTVDRDDMDKESLYLSPGMPATVFIATTERTIVYYMFEPYIKSWQRALRD